MDVDDKIQKEDGNCEHEEINVGWEGMLWREERK